MHTEGSTTFVYKKNGGSIVKQVVQLGMINENATVVTRGVTEQDELLLVTPPEAEKLPVVQVDGSH